MRVLVVGAGGREHALVHALKRSPQAPEVLCAPGNAGIRRDATPLAADPDEPAALARAAADARVDLVVVGPEAPLVAGVADALAGVGVPCFGPSAEAARLEGSKAFAKGVMEDAGVPTAGHWVIRTVPDGLAAVRGYPAVLKADGLAGGKGVVIASDEGEARAALETMLVERRWGNHPAVVEEFLEGREVSLLALCDGQRALPLAPARDYKRARDGDQGPNTGGMGAFSPVPEVGAELAEELCAAVHQPVVDLLAERGTPFHGVLYAGLMLTAQGPRVLEFNVRFGDPEAQALLPRLRSDLVELLRAAAEPGGLAGAALEWDPGWAVTVVLAARGYPDAPELGAVITGLEAVPEGVEVTHAGTAEGEGGGGVVVAGGRVLAVTGRGRDPRSAREAAYAAAEVIVFEGKQVRRDVAAEVGEP